MKENFNNSWPPQEVQQRLTLGKKYWLVGLILVGLLLALPGFLVLTQMTHPHDDSISANATVVFLIGMATIAVASLPAFVRSIPRIIRSAWSLWFTRRRWLRFGLRTFFVLAMVLGIYFGWAVNLKWTRQGYLKENDVAGPFSNCDGSKIEDVPAPWSLQIFNGKGVPILYFYSAEEQSLIEVSRIFPEAKICFCDVTKNGVFSYTVQIDDDNWDWSKMPYYKNGVLFQKELILTAPAPK